MSDQIPKDARQEIKFVCRHSEYQTLLHWLRFHPQGFHRAFPDRHVNNIYFDTHNYAAYVGNLSGESARTKVRYRWYGQKQGPSAGRLEIKRKRNFFSWKLLFHVAENPFVERDSWANVKNGIYRQISDEGKRWMDSSSFPVMLNRYRRNYFISADKRVRVTIDHDQAVWDQRYKPYPNFIHRAHLPQTIVVEIKFDRTDRELGSAVMQGIPIRVSRHSKYMNAVDAISGNMP